MADVRKQAEDFISQVPETSDVTSDGATAALFTKLTGSTHEGLQATWAREDVAKQKRRDEAAAAGKRPDLKGLPTTTTCNAFTGVLGAAVKAPANLGAFTIADDLRKAGLGEAWITPAGGKRPGCGDVFRPVPPAFHMGVSHKFVGDEWHTVESGQGGPGENYRTGRDRIKRKHRPWNPADIAGWVDIEILARLGTKAPKWLVGWWQLEVSGRKEFMWLPERGSPTRVVTKPANVKAPPPAGGGTAGERTLADDSEGMKVVWADGPVDDLRHLPGVDYMLGSRGADQVQAYKLK